MRGNAGTLEDFYRASLQVMPSPFEAGQAFSFLTGRGVGDLAKWGGFPASAYLWSALERMGVRRRTGEPLQYLLGEWEFYSLPFSVGPGVLIPRPETELLVDLALAFCKGLPHPKILDLCSGSGCIAVAVAKHFPDSSVTAVENSPGAFSYLLKNMKKNQAAVRAVLADAKTYRPREPVDLILANPPYIPRGDLAGLQEEVRREPTEALNGGEDGLDFYRAFAEMHPSLTRGGRMYLEVGMGQQESVEAILKTGGFRSTGWLPDLAGIPRVVFGEA